jgi:formiminoglutamate deiminase
MIKLFFETALLPDGWARHVTVGVGDDGLITAVEPDSAAAPDAVRDTIAVPGMANLHSHAFQRGMAGLAERAGSGPDSFWTWREVMYRFLDRLTPDDVEAIARQLYVEMLETGFTAVGEFHYLHHDTDGSPYADPAEMAERIVSAADATGIGLTLLPVLYHQGGFGAVPLTQG